MSRLGGATSRRPSTTGFHGEDSDGSSDEEGTESDEPSYLSTWNVPADQALRVVQTVKTGESQVPVTDLLELDLAFAVIDWKHLNSGSPLGGNADWKGYKDTKSRVVMVVDSLDDLRLILTGQHREYPGFKGKDWSHKTAIHNHFDWLLESSHRTIKVTGTEKYKQGLWGDVAPQLEDPARHI